MEEDAAFYDSSSSQPLSLSPNHSCTSYQSSDTVGFLRCGSYLQSSHSLPTETRRALGAQGKGAPSTLRACVAVPGSVRHTQGYSLKNWDVVELDFLHCLGLGLCEEEEGHLEATRSLELCKEAEEHQGPGINQTRDAL